jgi:hypothetical protein
MKPNPFINRTCYVSEEKGRLVMKRPPSDKTIGDAAYEISKAVISVVPVAGGPLVTLFENIFTTPLNKRKQKWFEELAGVINEIQEKLDGVTPEHLSRNEMFITAALQASQIAIRNHKKEKIEALRNALFNSVKPNAPSDDKQLIFFRLIDDLTPWHLRLLGLLNDPERWMANNSIRNPGWGMGGVSTVIEHCLPDLRGARDFYDQLTRDLQAGGLVHQGSFLNVTMTGGGMLASRTSDIGKEFISFISRPDITS